MTLDQLYADFIKAKEAHIARWQVFQVKFLKMFLDEKKLDEGADKKGQWRVSGGFKTIDQITEEEYREYQVADLKHQESLGADYYAGEFQEFRIISENYGHPVDGMNDPIRKTAFYYVKARDEGIPALLMWKLSDDT